MTFEELRVAKQLVNALNEMDIVYPTPIQEKCFRRITSGKDVIGIAQTGTGKTYAYLLPILDQLEFSEQKHPRILIVVPTRELVVQVMNEAEKLSKYKSVRIKGVYGGTNINTQKENIYDGGCDILVGTPGRLYDIAVTGVLRLSAVRKIVIDEVDEMLSLGFRPQLEQILEMLPQNRQNLMFSSTLKDDINIFINKYFCTPERIEISKQSTPVEKIVQEVYKVQNFNTKVNFLRKLLSDNNEIFVKNIVFVDSKKQADYVFEKLSDCCKDKIAVIHSNKSQNFRFNSIRNFEKGVYSTLIATDVVARGLDFTDISHVINLTPPENPIEYIHRIGRTGRVDKNGNSILMIAPYEEDVFEKILEIAGENITLKDFPADVPLSSVLTDEEKPVGIQKNYIKNPTLKNSGGAFHEKSEKRLKTNSGGLKQKALRKRRNK